MEPKVPYDNVVAANRNTAVFGSTMPELRYFVYKSISSSPAGGGKKEMITYIKNPRSMNGESEVNLLFSVQIFRNTIFKYMFWYTLDQRQRIFGKFRGNVVVVTSDPFRRERLFFIAYIANIGQAIF